MSADPGLTTETVRSARFGPETDALLARLGAPAALDASTLAAARAEKPDPAVAGRPVGGVRIEERRVPMRWGSCRLRVYVGTDAGDAPVVLWLHGGAFVGGSVEDLDAPCSSLAAAAAVVVASLDYRLAPEHPFPAAVEDTDDALGWLLDHGSSLGGNGEVFVGGQSAGACLAAAACLMRRDHGRDAVAGQVLCYPVLDFGQDTESARLFDGVMHSYRSRAWPEQAYLAGQPVSSYAAPLRAESVRGLPPALVIGAGRDPFRDDARRYAARLCAEGLDVRHVEYDATMHAFLNFWAVHSAGPHAVDEIAGWIADHRPPT